MVVVLPLTQWTTPPLISDDVDCGTDEPPVLPLQPVALIVPETVPVSPVHLMPTNVADAGPAVMANTPARDADASTATAKRW